MVLEAIEPEILCSWSSCNRGSQVLLRYVVMKFDRIRGLTSDSYTQRVNIQQIPAVTGILKMTQYIQLPIWYDVQPTNCQKLYEGRSCHTKGVKMFSVVNICTFMKYDFINTAPCIWLYR